MAPVIHIAFLELTDQRIPAAFAGDVLAKEKIVDLAPPVEPPCEHVFHVIEEALRDQRLMNPGVDLTGSPDADQPHVEGIVQNRGESVSCDPCSPKIPEAQTVQFVD